MEVELYCTLLIAINKIIVKDLKILRWFYNILLVDPTIGEI